MDFEKNLELLQDIAARFDESSEQFAAVNEVTEALRIASGAETRPRLEDFLLKADSPLGEEEKRNLEEMGIDPSDATEGEGQEGTVDFEEGWEQCTAKRYPAGSDEFEAAMSAFRTIIPSLNKSRVLEKIAKSYVEDSEEYAALYQAAYAEIFLQNESANLKAREYIKNLGRELTDGERRAFRWMGLNC